MTHDQIIAQMAAVIWTDLADGLTYDAAIDSAINIAADLYVKADGAYRRAIETRAPGESGQIPARITSTASNPSGEGA